MAVLPDDDVSSVARLLARFSSNTVLRDEAGFSLFYADILECSLTEPFQSTRRHLVMCLSQNDTGGLSGYLALLAAQAVPLMVGAASESTTIARLIQAYQPEFLWLPESRAKEWPRARPQASLHGYCLLALPSTPERQALHPKLSLLLSTSGSTGSAKYVRLSQRNVWTNAASIANYLGLSADEVPITTLPLNYSYGLSVIHSHLWVGACIAVTSKSFFDAGFWNFLRSVRATSLAGVPYHYEMLKKLRFNRMDLPCLRTLTQAGGRADPDLIREFATHCANNGMRFFAMYGQTEAAPRMSYVPAEQAIAKAGCIGLPIPGGSFELQDEMGKVVTADDTAGELIYRGPNVCMGYAEHRTDLSLGDSNHGVLRTGDIAQRDSDGCYRIVGRKKRFLKLFGNRVNLQDIEDQLTALGLCAACAGSDDLLEIYWVGDDPEQASALKISLASSLRVGVQALVIYGVSAMPRTEAGKISYAQMRPSGARLLA